MLKENNFYVDDNGRKLLYLGQEKSFHAFGDDTKFSEFIYHSSGIVSEFMGILKLPTKRISNKHQKLNIPEHLLCIHKFVYPYKTLISKKKVPNYHFKKLKTLYFNALEKEVSKSL
jgi:hypothetical protein